MDKLVCVGKNYAEHAKELGDAVPEKPVLFLKPPSVLRQGRGGETLSLTVPRDAGSLHHECEIVLRLCAGGFRMSKEEARRAIGAVTLGLDMTLRDRQALLKKQGHPWETSKVFPDAAAAGPWVAVDEFPAWQTTPFTFTLDGTVRQQGSAGQMLLSPADCVAYASEHFALCVGDLLYTGTPAGVGPVTAGATAVLHWGPIAYTVGWKA